MTSSTRKRHYINRPVPVWWVLVSCVVSVVLMVGVNVLYTNYVDRKGAERERQADRRWCALLELFDSNYQRNPPATETGREAARLMHALVESTGC